MASINDQAFLTKFHEDMQKLVPEAIRSVETYRDFLPRLLEDRKNSEPLPEVGQHLTNISINGHFSADVGVPVDASDRPFPVILVCHGNGATSGSPHTYRRFTRDLTAAGYLTVTPDFRLAPEHKHPAGLDDLFETAIWIRDNARKYGGDGTNIVVCGDSVGAALALSTVHRLVDSRDAPSVAAFVGLEGFYDRSRDKGFMIDAFMPEGYTEDDLRHPWVSPSFGMKSGMTFPPILLITGSADFAAPSTVSFALELLQKQIPFQLHVIEDMVHDFMKFPELDGYREGHRLMFEFLDKHA